MKNEFNKVSLKNFGILKNINIDIAPLTVFTGDNNSGKSFVAKLIHSFSSIDGDDFHKGIDLSFSDTPKYFDENHKKIFSRLSDEIASFFKNNFNKNPQAFKIPLPLFNDLIDEGILKYFSIIFEEKITEEFVESLDNLINFKEDFFEITLNNYVFFKKREKTFEFIPELVELTNASYVFPGNESVLIELESDDEFVYLSVKSKANAFRDFKSIFPVTYSGIAHLLLNNILLEKSYYIPAGRCEIICDKKMLSRHIKNESDISKTQSEVLYNIINIDCDSKGDFYELGCEFDREFSGILVDVQQSGFINEITYSEMDSASQISSRILSTSIHEMTLFSLYLKYVLKKGDFLIIEEPEAHLHPKKQRIIIKYFILAINMGLNIVMTTHSDYIIEQLNNYVRLGNVKDEFYKDYGSYSKDLIMDFNKIILYHFKENDNHTFSSSEVPINFTGFCEKNFKEVIEDLCDEAENIIDYKLR